MAQGNNKAYMSNPENYLMNHDINRNPGPGYAVAAGGAIPIPSPGPSNIDLVPPPGPGPAGVVQIQDYNSNQHGYGAKPIRAYWLEAKPNKSIRIILGNAANYFFTYNFTGCLFTAFFDNLHQLFVEHTNDIAHAGLIAARLKVVSAMSVNGPIRVLTPIPWPPGLPLSPLHNHNIVHYPVVAYAWVIGGRVGAGAPGGWRFKYKLSTAPAIVQVL